MKIKHIVRVASGVGLLLLVALWGSYNVEGWNWSGWDFLFAGIVFSITGFSLEFLISRSQALMYKIASTFTVLTAFVLIWGNAAVGFIGEDNPVNLMYVGIVLMLIVGAYLVRLKPYGMSRVLFLVASAQMIAPVIAYIFWPSNFAPGTTRIFVLSVLFTLLWTASALLFRRAHITHQ